jgi:cytochrome c553
MQPIQGRKADEIAAAMVEFRNGARAATVMDRIAKGFNEDETRAIAAWLSEQAP